jgi:hypothetical protein
MGALMSNRQILLMAMALGFLGGFSFVAMANGVAISRDSTPPSAYASSAG